MIVIIEICSVLLLLYLLYGTLLDLLPRKDTRCKLYCHKKLKRARFSFFDRIAGVWCGDNFVIIVLDNASIGVCKDDKLLFLIKFINIGKANRVFKNQLLYRFGNIISVTRKGIVISKASNYSLKISVKNTVYETNITKGKIVIDSFAMQISNGIIKDITLDKGEMSVFFGSESVEIEFCESFKSTSRCVAQQIVRSYFGIFDINNEIHCIPAYSPKMRKRLEYIYQKLDKNNWSIAPIRVSEEHVIQRVVSPIFNCTNTQIKFNLTKLGISNIYALKKIGKNVLKIKDLMNNYTFYLRFNTRILDFYKNTFWGENFVLIQLDKVGICEFLPFDKNMDISFLNLQKIPIVEKYLVNQNKDSEEYSLNVLIELINRALLLGVNLDIHQVLNNLVLENLEDVVKFDLANMILSYIQVTQDRDILKEQGVIQIIMDQNRTLYRVSKGRAKCYLKKLLYITVDAKVKELVNDLLGKLQNFCDMSSWESVFSDVLGIRLVKNRLYLTKSPYENTARIDIRGKTINFSNISSMGYIKCNDRVMSGVDYICLDTQEKEFNVEI